MTKKQQQIIGGGVVVCLLLLAAGFFLLVKPKKSQITSIKQQTSSEDAANATLRSQISMLQQQQASLVGKQVVLRQVAQRIPSDPQIPSLIRQIMQMQGSTGVDVVAITPGAPTATASTTTTPTVTTPTTTDSGAATTTSTTATHPGATAASATYQTIPVTLSVQGNYSQMVMFLDKIENLQRLYLVKSLTITPNKASSGTTGATTTPDGKAAVGDALTATLTGEVYDTSADTTNIDLPALKGASTSTTATTSGTTTPAVAASPAATVN